MSILLVFFLTNVSFAKGIVVSIKPAYFITLMVTGGDNTRLIVKNNTSPHDISLTYNQTQQIIDSDLVIIVSKSLEKEIFKVAQKNSKRIIILDEIKSLQLKKFEIINIQNDEKSSAKSIDYHFWLDPTQVQIIIGYLAKEIGQQYPEKSKIYAQNIVKYNKDLNVLNNNIKDKLSSTPLKLMTYHNGWQYFMDRYKINYFGSVVGMENESAHDHGSETLSAKDFISLKAYLQRNSIQCVAMEEQFKDKAVERFLQQNNVKVIFLNPIDALSQGLNVNHYFTMMQNNANTIKDCLQ
jgi:zinc/manganese transport system substrate-binding protein